MADFLNFHFFFCFTFWKNTVIILIKQEEKDLTEKLEKKKQRIQESMTNLRPYHLKLLMLHQFFDEMKKKYSEDDVTMHIEKTKIVLTGLPNTIQEVKVCVLLPYNNVFNLVIL